MKYTTGIHPMSEVTVTCSVDCRTSEWFNRMDTWEQDAVLDIIGKIHTRLPQFIEGIIRDNGDKADTGVVTRPDTADDSTG